MLGLPLFLHAISNFHHYCRREYLLLYGTAPNADSISKQSFTRRPQCRSVGQSAVAHSSRIHRCPSNISSTTWLSPETKQVVSSEGQQVRTGNSTAMSKQKPDFDVRHWLPSGLSMIRRIEHHEIRPKNVSGMIMMVSSNIIKIFYTVLPTRVSTERHDYRKRHLPPSENIQGTWNIFWYSLKIWAILLLFLK